MVQTVVATWWARTVLTIAFVFGVGSVITLLDLPSLLSATLLLISLTGLLLCIEQLRGSMHTSALLWHTNSLRLLGFGALLALGMLAMFVSVAVLLGAAIVRVHPNMSEPIIAISGIVVAAVLEEVLFRGTIFEAFHERFGPTAAILGTSLLFGFAHMINPGANVLSVLNTILAGILLGLLVAHCHTLYAAITFHVAWNVLVALCVGNVSGMNLGIGIVRLDLSHIALPWLFGGAYGIEEGALTTGLLVVAILLTLKYAPLDAETRAARYRRRFSITLTPAT